jgi:hypothetical protein
MKTLILILTLLFLVGCSTTGYNSYTPENRTRYYSKDGTYQGYSKEVGSQTNFYNSKGQYIGKSKK